MTAATGAPDGTPPAPDGKGGNPNDKEFVPVSERDEAIKRRDAALKRAQDAEAKVKEFEDAETKRKNDEAAAKGDHEAVRKALEAETQAEKAKREKAERDAEQLIIERDAVKIFAEIAVNPGLAAKVLQGELEIVTDEDGKKHARPKKSNKGLKEWAEERCEQEGIPLKNQRKGGTGAKGSDDTNKGGLTLEDIQKMPPGEQKAAFAKNPDLAKEAWK